MTKNKKKKSRRRVKFLLAAFLIVAAAIFYFWGSLYYQKEQQIKRLVQGISDPSLNMTTEVVPSTPDLTVTRHKLKPLQAYFQHNPAATKRLKANLERGEDKGQIQLVQEGRHLLLFPKYVLRVQVFRPQVETNHTGSKLWVDHENYGRMVGAVSNFYQDLGLVLPGRYHLSVQAKVSGRQLKADSVVNIWSNKTVDMRIRTGTFQVRSVPGGIIYLNDKRVKKLSRYGKAIFKNYPLTRKMELYVVTTYRGQKLRSETVKDLSSSINPAFSQSDDSLDDYSNSTAYTGNSAKDVYQDVEGDYIVNPIWPGLVKKGQAEEILRRSYQKAKRDDFVNAKDWRDLRRQERRWQRGMKKVRVSVRVTNILPAGKDSSQVTYQVVYHYRRKSKKKKKILPARKAIFWQVKNVQLLQSVGQQVK